MNEEDKDNTNEILNFIRIKCHKCNVILTKTHTLKNMIECSNDSTYKMKFYNLLMINILNGLKKNSYRNSYFLSENVVCSNCKTKIGLFVKSCSNLNWDLIDCVIMGKERIIL